MRHSRQLSLLPFLERGMSTGDAAVEQMQDGRVTLVFTLMRVGAIQICLSLLLVLFIRPQVA